MTVSTRRRLIAWGLMGSLTASAVFVGHAGQDEPLGAVLIVSLLTISFAKLAILLAEYLDLRHAPGWNRGLRFAIALLLVLIAGLSILATAR